MSPCSPTGSPCSRIDLLTGNLRSLGSFLLFRETGDLFRGDGDRIPGCGSEISTPFEALALPADLPWNGGGRTPSPSFAFCCGGLLAETASPLPVCGGDAASAIGPSKADLLYCVFNRPWGRLEELLSDETEEEELLRTLVGGLGTPAP